MTIENSLFSRTTYFILFILLLFTSEKWTTPASSLACTYPGTLTGVEDCLNISGTWTCNLCECDSLHFGPTCNCLREGTSSALTNGTCSCLSYFTGPRCSCFSDGTSAAASDESSACTCNALYQGPQCRCFSEGTHLVATNGTCLCTEDFTGRSCSCFTQGTSNANAADGSCSCSSLYAGSRCRCLREGTNLTNTDGTCTCLSYFTGPRCSCFSTGTNSSASNGSCTCSSLYSGPRCSCLNEGTSAAYSDGTCYCLSAYTGPRCSCIRAGISAYSPDGTCSCTSEYSGSLCRCFNEGTQTARLNGTCACTADFTGPSCSCLKVGTSAAVSADGSCTCSSLYTGSRCRCLREGLHSTNSNGTCNCQSYFTGPRCSCFTKGTTLATANGSCTCSSLYSGSRCRCLNEGTNTAHTDSSCSCLSAYTGPRCSCMATGTQYAYADGSCDCTYTTSSSTTLYYYTGPQCRCWRERTNSAWGDGTCSCSSGYMGPRCYCYTTGTVNATMDRTCTCNSAYDNSQCSTRICSRDNDCNYRGLSVSGTYPSCSCSCKVPYSGTNCQTENCHRDFHCSSRGTTSGTVPCYCACDLPFTGNKCQTEYCHKDFHCTGRGRSITGIFPNCVCTCKTPQYIGNACESHICHHDYDCNDHGYNATGYFPNCICSCHHGYGGRTCRTLSQTLSLTITKSAKVTMSRSLAATPSLSRTTSLSSSATLSFSISLSQSSTSSGTVSSTRSLSSSHSLTASPSATHSSSLSLTSSVSITPSPTVSTSLTLSISTSYSLSLSRTLSQSPSLSSSSSITGTISLSSSSTVSLSTSNSLSSSDSLSLTHTPSQPTPSSTETVSASQTYSASETFSCRDYDNLDAFDTCSVLRPLPVSWQPFHGNETDSPTKVSSTWLFGTEGNCTRITIPFDQWTGRQGSTHTIYFVGIESRVPLKTYLGQTGIDSGDLVSIDTALMVPTPITFQFRSVEEILNATRSGALRDPPLRVLLPNDTGVVTNVYPVAIVTLRYDGLNSLSRIEYSLSCRDWARCPITMSTEMHIRLEALTRLFPETVAQVISTGSSIISFGGAMSLSPTAVLQLGMVTSLKEMSRCKDTKLDDPTDDDSYDDFAKGILNPYGLNLGGGGGRGFIRGALVTSGVYLMFLTALTFGLTFVFHRIKLASYALDIKDNTDSKANIAAPVPLLAGYPAALIAVVSFAMDGAVSAGTMLAVFGDGWADRVMGSVSVIVCSLYVCHILFVTVKRFPPSLVARSLTNAAAAEDNELSSDFSALLDNDLSDKTEPSLDSVLQTSFTKGALSRDFSFGFGRKSGGYYTSPPKGTGLKVWADQVCHWLEAPTHEWQPDQNDAVSLQWMDRYEGYISNSKLTWYCALEQTVALVTCVLSSLGFEQLYFCISRGVICFLLLGGQLLVMIILRPTLHKWRWALVSVAMGFQVLTAALSVVNAPLQHKFIELSMDTVGAAVFVVLTLISLADVFILVASARGPPIGLRTWLKWELSEGWKYTPPQVQPSNTSLASLSSLPTTPVLSHKMEPLLPPELMIDINTYDLNGTEAVVKEVLKEFQMYQERIEYEIEMAEIAAQDR